VRGVCAVIIGHVWFYQCDHSIPTASARCHLTQAPDPPRATAAPSTVARETMSTGGFSSGAALPAAHIVERIELAARVAARTVGLR